LQLLQVRDLKHKVESYPIFHHKRGPVDRIEDDTLGYGDISCGVGLRSRGPSYQPNWDFLRLLPGERQYARVRLDDGDIGSFEWTFRRESVYVSIYVRQNVRNIDPTDLMYGFWLQTLPLKLSGFWGRRSISLPGARPRDEWDAAKRIFRIPVGSRGTAGRLRYDVESLSPNSTFDLEFGFNRDFWPVI
jgi:hypothetical protein